MATGDKYLDGEGDTWTEDENGILSCPYTVNMGTRDLVEEYYGHLEKVTGRPDPEPTDDKPLTRAELLRAISDTRRSVHNTPDTDGLLAALYRALEVGE